MPESNFMVDASTARATESTRRVPVACSLLARQLLLCDDGSFSRGYQYGRPSDRNEALATTCFRAGVSAVHDPAGQPGLHMRVECMLAATAVRHLYTPG